MRGPSGSGKKRTDNNKARTGRVKTQSCWIRMGGYKPSQGGGFLFPCPVTSVIGSNDQSRDFKCTSIVPSEVRVCHVEYRWGTIPPIMCAVTSSNLVASLYNYTSSSTIIFERIRCGKQLFG